MTWSSTVQSRAEEPIDHHPDVVHLLLEEVVGPLTPSRSNCWWQPPGFDRLLAMVNDLLDLTRIEQGGLRLDLQPVAPGELVGEASSGSDEGPGRRRRPGGDVATDLPESWRTGSGSGTSSTT